MDDEKLAYKAYEKFAKAGLVNVCVHKGLFPPSVEKQFPHLLAYSRRARRRQGGQGLAAAELHHLPLGYRYAGGGRVEDAWAQFEKTGRIEWVTDLAEIPAKYGVSNVYADLGQIFAQTTVAEPRAVRGHDGPAGHGPRRRPRGVGHRRHLDRLAAVADRGAAPAGDSRGHAEEVRLQAARRRRTAR